MFAHILGGPDLSVRVVPVAADLFFFTAVFVYGTHSGVVDINVETSHASYTDPEQIKELLSVIVESGYYNPWYDYSLINDQYSVQVYRNGEFDEYSSTYYSILKGKVPQFVKEDTN